jgi:hypothetical protein
LTLGDGIRHNFSKLCEEEKIRFRDAILKLHQNYLYPDGVSGWFKQDQIHQATHVHGGPGFLPWHRELCNRFETLLREVDSLVSLHYWDFQEDVEQMNILGPDAILGSSHGVLASPFDIIHNKGKIVGSRTESNPPDPAKPPVKVERDVGLDISFPFAYPDEQLISRRDGLAEEAQWNKFRNDLEFDFHGQAHGYIGGNLNAGHTAFEDFFVYLLHSNVDRLWASWQLQPGKEWRLDPGRIYGLESNKEVQLNEYMEPWAGGSTDPRQKIRPWGSDWPAEKKNAKDDSIVRRVPKYDKYTMI